MLMKSGNVGFINVKPIINVKHQTGSFHLYWFHFFIIQKKSLKTSKNENMLQRHAKHFCVAFNSLFSYSELNVAAPCWILSF